MDALEIGGVRIGDADQVVGRAGQQIAFEQSGWRPTAASNRSSAARPCWSSVTNTNATARQAHDPLVEQGRVAGDAAALLELAQTRRRQAEGERWTRSASSALVSRPSLCSRRRMARSRSSISIGVCRTNVRRRPALRSILPRCRAIAIRTAGYCATEPATLADASAVADRKAERNVMRIGVPKEIKDNEFRVGLIPSSVAELVHHGHRSWCETGAGPGRRPVGCRLQHGRRDDRAPAPSRSSPRPR